jgi:hypothetical protein
VSVAITREVAEKCLSVIDKGLTSGMGEPVPGSMCVEAAINYALGRPHGDDPGCVAQSLRRLKIRLNDAQWSSRGARAQGLRRLALAQLGSAGVLDDEEFVRRVVEMTIRRAVPIGLRAAAVRNPKHAADLEAAAVRCEREGTREAASEGERVARAAYAAYADAAAYDAAAADAYDAAYDAASAASAASGAAAYDAASAAYAADAAYAYDAAYDAASAYAYDAAAYAAAYAAADAAYASAYYAAYDRVLAQYAEWVVEILIAMNAPGVQWLDLAPLEAV